MKEFKDSLIELRETLGNIKDHPVPTSEIDKEIEMAFEKVDKIIKELP